MYKGVNELRNYTCRDKGFTEKFINIQRCVKFAKKKETLWIWRENLSYIKINLKYANWLRETKMTFE